jgi:hypothetical protein
MGRISLLVIAAALLSLAATANEDAIELERLLAKVRSDPMIFVVNTGEPNACGRGCTEWIGAEGEFDDGAAQRFQEFITHLENRNRPIFFNSDGGLVGEAVKIGLILRENRMTAGVARSVPPARRWRGRAQGRATRKRRDLALLRQLMTKMSVAKGG